MNCVCGVCVSACGIVQRMTECGTGNGFGGEIENTVWPDCRSYFETPQFPFLSLSVRYPQYSKLWSSQKVTQLKNPWLFESWTMEIRRKQKPMIPTLGFMETGATRTKTRQFLNATRVAPTRARVFLSSLLTTMPPTTINDIDANSESDDGSWVDEEAASGSSSESESESESGSGSGSEASDASDVENLLELGQALIYGILQRKPIEDIRTILDAGAPLWYQDEDGWSCLHAAASLEDEKLTKVLLDEGAVWNAGTF